MARMSLFRKIAIIAAPAAALLALSGCASPFRADVARFPQLPAPQGPSFSVMPDDPQLSGGLEFSQYSNLVANELAEKGYVRSADPAAADLVVRLDYGVDNGREKIRSTGFYRDPFYGPYGFFPRFYGHGRFLYGYLIGRASGREVVGQSG